MTDNLNTPADRLAFWLSRKKVQECVSSLRRGDNWKVNPADGGLHRTKPYPMGFYPSDPNLYYAIGWGWHVEMWPHERWLVNRAAALRARSETDG